MGDGCGKFAAGENHAQPRSHLCRKDDVRARESSWKRSLCELPPLFNAELEEELTVHIAIAKLKEDDFEILQEHQV